MVDSVASELWHVCNPRQVTANFLVGKSMWECVSRCVSVRFCCCLGRDVACSERMFVCVCVCVFPWFSPPLDWLVGCLASHCLDGLSWVLLSLVRRGCFVVFSSHNYYFLTMCFKPVVSGIMFLKGPSKLD